MRDAEVNNDQNKNALNQKAAKAGAFFVVVQLLVRGITFLITPIYTRLVSTAQYGEIRVYESWLLILVPLFSLSLYKSVRRAKYDFREDYDQYISSVQSLSYLVIAVSYLLITVFFREAFMRFMNLNSLMFVYMVLYTFAHTSVLFFQTRESQLLRYEQSVRLTVLMMIPATVGSVGLLYLGNIRNLQDRLVDLRIIGYYTPQIIGGLTAAILIWKQGRFAANRRYWKYAVAYSLPLIPETISIQIMNQSDKIMIQKMVGNEVTGIFSLATTISFIIWIVEDSVWGAWVPWLYEKLDREEIADIQKPWDYISYIFGFLSWCLVILAPELICILGGTKYREAVYLVAPMVTGTLFRFFSYSFTAVESYKKKTKYCALGSFTAMIINVILNAVCIKYIGYQAAAYTTAFSYFVLLVLQGWLEKKTCGVRCVSLKKTALLSLVFLGINEITILLYQTGTLVRWGVFVLTGLLVMWKLKDGFLMIRKQMGKKR